MKRFYLVLMAILLVMMTSLAGCTQPGKTQAQAEPVMSGDTVFQVSTINALLQGIYDGEMSVGRLKEYGDLGIGTFHGLDGEMVLVDGVVYQVKADGNVLTPEEQLTTPFATVTFFQADQTRELGELVSYEQLQQQVDGMLTNRNLFYALRLDGVFSYVKTRSVPPQAKPYPPLAEVTKQQLVFELHDVKGTIVAFYCPQYVEGLNVPGYHMHFITEGRLQGGHLLECHLEEGTLQIDHSPEFHLVLPASDDFARADLVADRRDELERVEK